MKKSHFILIASMLQITVCTLSAQIVYTPHGYPVEVHTYSAGNVAKFENEAALYIESMGWTNDVTKTGDATGVYNCHVFAWNGTNYWMYSATDADRQGFDKYDINTTLPSVNNLNTYWMDGSYLEVTENNATRVYYGSCWQWDSNYGWTNPCSHSAKRITSGADAGKYESKWGSWGRYIHPASVSPYDDSQRRFFKLNPSPPYYIGTNFYDYSGESIIFTDSNGYAGTTIYAFSSVSSPNSYVWSASWEGDCNRWYIWPTGSHADLSFYLDSNDEGGILQVECAMYDSSTFLGTGFYYLDVY